MKIDLLLYHLFTGCMDLKAERNQADAETVKKLVAYLILYSKISKSFCKPLPTQSLRVPQWQRVLLHHPDQAWPGLGTAHLSHRASALLHPGVRECDRHNRNSRCSAPSHPNKPPPPHPILTSTVWHNTGRWRITTDPQGASVTPLSSLPSLSYTTVDDVARRVPSWPKRILPVSYLCTRAPTPPVAW